MNLLKDQRAQEYLANTDPKMVEFGMLNRPTNCLCILKNLPENSHSGIVTPFSRNLAELAAYEGAEYHCTMPISKEFYFNSDTMVFLINEMLNSENVVTVEQYYNVLDLNFSEHPPCASYMNVEYEQLLLSSNKQFLKEMTLWDYLIENFNLIINGSLLYGDNKVFDTAFKRCFSFCLAILEVDFEVSKMKNVRPLIMKCLRFNPVRKTRLSEITKVLDMLFNTGYDFQILVIRLAKLINDINKIN